MEVETIFDKDRFGNYKTNRFPCPRCGAEFLVYVAQWDSHMCDECDWSEDPFGSRTDLEELDYEHPVRERLRW